MIWAKNSPGGHRVAARLDFPYLPNSYICLADAYFTLCCTLTLQRIGGAISAIYWGWRHVFWGRNKHSGLRWSHLYSHVCTSCKCHPAPAWKRRTRCTIALEVIHRRRAGLVQVTLRASRRENRCSAPQFYGGRGAAPGGRLGRRRGIAVNLRRYAALGRRFLGLWTRGDKLDTVAR